MNSCGAFLGQVSLGCATPGLSEGDEIPATGGIITKHGGSLWFFPDAATRSKLEEVFGEPIPESVAVMVAHCNPTPGTVPALGDFEDPETGFVCFLDLPEGWQHAWMWGSVDDAPLDEFEVVPPFYVEFSGPATNGRITAGPFANAMEAFDYAGSSYGGMAPAVGHIEVYDSLDQLVIIT